MSPDREGSQQGHRLSGKHEEENRLVLAAKELVEIINREDAAPENADWAPYHELFLFLAERIHKVIQKAWEWGAPSHVEELCGKTDEYLAKNLEKLLLRFEPERGVPFSKFIAKGVAGAQKKYWDEICLVHYPESVRDLYTPVSQALDELEAEGTPRDRISDDMVSARVIQNGRANATLKLVGTCLQRMRFLASLDAPCGDDDGDGGDATGYERVAGETPNFDEFDLADMLSVMRCCATERPAFLGCDGDAGEVEIVVLRTRLVWEDEAFREILWEKVIEILDGGAPCLAGLSIANAKKKASLLTSRFELAYHVLDRVDLSPEEFVEAYQNDVEDGERPKLPRVRLKPEAVRLFRCDYTEWLRMHDGWRQEGKNPLGGD
jgi:hypothetical protein